METAAQNDDFALPAGFEGKSGGSKFEYRKLKREDDTLIERILPAWGGLVDKGDIGVYSKLHYGWKVKHPSDPTKTIHRPFLCVEERSGGMITRECPACKLRSGYEQKMAALIVEEKAKAEEGKAKAKAAGATDAQIAPLLAKLADKYREEKSAIANWLKDHGVDKKVLMATINKKEAFGITQIPWGMAAKLKKEIKKIEARKYPESIAKGRDVNIQARGVWGVFFEFSRTGQSQGGENDRVDVHMTQQADGSMLTVFHKATKELLERAKNTLPDLVQHVEENRVSFDVVQKLVDHCVECGGSCDPETVDAIMGPKKSKPAPTKSYVDSKPETKEVAPEVPAAVAAAFDDALTSEVKATPAAKPAEAPVAKAEPTVTAKPAEAPEVKAEPSQPAAVAGADMAQAQFDEMFA